MKSNLYSKPLKIACIGLVFTVSLSNTPNPFRGRTLLTETIKGGSYSIQQSTEQRKTTLPSNLLKEDGKTTERKTIEVVRKNNVPSYSQQNIEQILTYSTDHSTKVVRFKTWVRSSFNRAYKTFKRKRLYYTDKIAAAVEKIRLARQIITDNKIIRNWLTQFDSMKKI